MGEHDAGPNARRTAALIAALLTAIFAFQLNASMLSPALATMEKALDASTAEIGLTQTAFFTSAAIFSLVMPRWGDLVGRRRVMLGLLAVTGIGCVVAALAPNVTILFIGRVVQGAAGPIVPMALIMLRAQMPDPKRYALWMGVLTSVNGGIAGVDALLGGWLADHFGFRSIFWVMTAVCAVAIVAVAAAIAETTASETPRMDWKGAAPLVIALGTILVAFNEAGDLAAANWTLVAGMLVAGAIAFAVFWLIEKRAIHPLVSVTYMKQRRTWALLLTTTLTMTGVFAVMNGIIPNLAQDPDFAGIDTDIVSWYTLTPYALAGLIMGPLSGRLAGRFGYRAILQVGQAGSIIGLGLTAFGVVSMTPVLLLILSAFVGITYAGMANIMLNGLGIVLSPRDNPGYLPGMNASAFNLGAGLSFAVLFAISTLFSSEANPASGYQAGILAGTIILVLALLASLLIPRPEQRAATDESTTDTAAARE